MGSALLIVGRNLELRDELFALRDATAQSWSHAEEMKARWAELDKAQTNLYQVREWINFFTSLLLLYEAYQAKIIWSSRGHG
jgi:hypothetical protein